MKFNRKGQGSIEYLMILAAVLAIAVVVVVLATTFFTRYRDPAEIAQDKSVCAASGIELKNYVDRYEDSTGANGAAGNLQVIYLGTEYTCQAPGGGGPDGDASCKIGTNGANTGVDCIRIYADDAGCEVEDLATC